MGRVRPRHSYLVFIWKMVGGGSWATAGELSRDLGLHLKLLYPLWSFAKLIQLLRSRFLYELLRNTPLLWPKIRTHAAFPWLWTWLPLVIRPSNIVQNTFNIRQNCGQKTYWFYMQMQDLFYKPFGLSSDSFPVVALVINNLMATRPRRFWNSDWQG